MRKDLKSGGTGVAALAMLPGVLCGLVACQPDRVEPDTFVRPPDAATGVVLTSDSGDGDGDGDGHGDGNGGGADGDRGSRAGGGAEGPEEGTKPDGGLASEDSGDVSSGLAPSPGSAACDLTGGWLVAQRVLVTAAGQQQSARTWYFYELSQAGSSLTVSRGLHCGYEVAKTTALGASVDSSGAWPSFLVHNSSSGRRGTVTPEAGQAGSCRLKMDREYVVRGATLPYYADPAIKLPDRTQAAGGGTPGWEDWDGDGNPGISIRVSSTLASGTLYDCQREWSEYDGLFAAGSTKFKLPLTANNEHVVLGRAAGAPQTLESSSSLASDPTQHYVWLHRLQPAQAAGTDAEVCASIRALKDQLLPEAAQ